MSNARRIILAFLPFWLFLAVFKFGGGLHYTLMSPYGVIFLPVWVVGALIGGASLVQLLFDVPAGYLLDRFGYVRMLKVTTFTFFLAGLCIAFGLTEITFFLSLMLSIFGWQFYDPGGSAYILTHATDKEAGRYFSLRDTFSSLGIVGSSIVLPFVLLLTPSAAGWILCGIFLIAFVTLLFSPPDTIRVPIHRASHISRRRKFKNLFTSMTRLNPASSMLILLVLSAAIFYGTVWFVIPLVIASQQNIAGLMGIGLGIFDFSVVVLGYAIGVLADKANKRTLVFFGLLIFSVFAAIVGFNFSWVFILFGFLATVGEEMAYISLWAWLHALDTDHEHDGTIAGIVTLFQDLGWAIGPAIAGILYSFVGPAWAIAFGALPIFVVWMIYFFFVHHRLPAGVGAAIFELLPHRPGRKHKS